MKKITVFTPTFNRAYCLHQCYESLCAQTEKGFVWLVIDDGSSDNTKELVSQWIAEDKIEIVYHFQENLGMHGGHNTAYRLITTELNVCIDSDDYMPPRAIEHILNCWERVENKGMYAGIIGLDAFKDDKIVGQRLPEDLKTTTLEDLHYKLHIGGDKKLVLRTEIAKKYPAYPIFKGEKFVPLGILYLMIDKDYELVCLNEVLCIVEYMPDGSSRNIVKQYFRHPKGFQYARTITMKYSSYPKVVFKNAVHYISHSIQLKDGGFLKKSPKKLMTLAAIPFGIALYAYVWYVNKVKK